MLGHNYGLPDCLKFIFECLGEYEELDFWKIGALSGDTVTQVYNQNKSTRCEYCVSGYLAGPEHIGYMLDTLCFDYEYVGAEQFNADTARYQQKIAEYIKRGVPVLVKTNLNDIPKWNSDVGTHCLIVGYDNDIGMLELLVGGTTPIRYSLTDNNKLDLVFIGEKQRQVPLEEIYLAIIKKMPHWLTLPERDGMFFGAAAYRKWAEDIDAGRFGEENISLWDNFGAYAVNLATNGDFSIGRIKELSEMNPKYASLGPLYEKIQLLVPTESPDGRGRSKLWIELDGIGGDILNMDNVKAIMRDYAKRAEFANVLRDFAGRLDQAVDLMNEELTV